jgi:hypothetical protein
MQKLKDYTTVAISMLLELDRLVKCIIAKLFFFKLDPNILLEKDEASQFLYVRYILYCLRSKTTIYKALFSKLGSNLLKFLLGKHLFPSSIRNCSSLNRDRNFKKRICFATPDRQSLITI